MKIIFAVVSALFAIVAWICTQTVWEYQYIIQYIAMFFASWFIVLMFVYQEESESSKKYAIFTPSNLIYVAIIIILLYVFKDYELSYWKTSTQSFWKMAIVVNGIQGVVTMLYYKIKDIYYNS